MDEKEDKDSYPSETGKRIIIDYILQNIKDWCIEEIIPTKKSSIRKIVFTRKEEINE